MKQTAAEFMAKLAENRSFQTNKKIKDKHFSNLKQIYANDEKKLVEELNNAGFSITSIWDFVNSRNYYLDVVDILINHLNIKHHPKILAGLASSLAIPEFSYNDKLWNSLVDLYSRTQPDAQINFPEEHGVQEAVAVALECLATESRRDNLEKLVAKIPDGDGIQWFHNKLKEKPIKHKKVSI